MRNFKRIWMTLLLALAVVISYVPMSMTAYAEAGDTPPHTKNVTDNQDGTYTISLDIVGESEKKPNNVNVIVIFDRSGSMGQPNNWQGQPTNGRLNAAKTAVNNLANSLFAYNTTDAPNTVQMALVDFSTTATSRTPTNSYDTFSGQVNSLSASGGTNWEDALQDAANVNFGDDDQTFVIFVSDGNPTFRNTRGSYNPMDDAYYGNPYNYGVYGNGSDSQSVGGISAATTISRCYNHAVDDAQALVDSVGADHFFTIGAYGNVDRMEDLTDDAGSDSSTNYYSAADTTALNQAMSDILAKIETVGFADAEIDDGTTNNVTTSSGDVAKLLELVPNFKYYRSGGTYGSMQEWTDAPEAEIVDGEVVWDLSDEGVLENGVRYTVTFDCYPSQETYDIIAQLKNGDMTDADLAEQGLDKYIVKQGNDYALRTNTNAGIKWNDTRNDEGPQTDSYKNPDPVATSADSLTIEKKWEPEGEAPENTEVPITVMMGNEEFHTSKVSAANGWKDSAFISVGIIKGDEALPGAMGHDFSFAELDDTQYHWEIDAPVVRPMLINGGGKNHTPTMLIKVDAKHPAPSGATTYTIDGSTYYVDEATTGLTATNHRRSNLNLRKDVTGEDKPKYDKDAGIDERDTFPFTLTVNNGKAPESEPEDDDEHNSDYWVWFSIYDTLAGATVMDADVSGATGPNSTGYYYAPSGSAISVEMKEGWNLRFINLPTGSDYTFEEGELEAGYEFKESKLTDPKDGEFTDGQTSTGSIDKTETSYQVVYTNDYALTDLEITKTWDDNDDQDGKRPSVEDFAAMLTLDPAVEGAEPTVVDNEDGTYTITYTDLPRFKDGEEVTYKVTESTVEDYDTPEYTNDGGETDAAYDHGEITNTHTPEKISVTVIKEWDDSDDIGEIRPASIQAQLYADGTASGSVQTLNEGNEWTYTWENLDKYAEGEEIEYTVDETAVPTGYSKDISDPEETDDGIEITITNTYNPTPVSVDPPVQKIIEGNDDLYNKGDFTFTIEATDPEDAPMPENTSITNSAEYELEDKTGYYEFGEIEFTMPGTYTYTVKESGSAPGVENDPDAETGKTLTFTVTDDGTGKLVVDPTTDEVELSFTNEYNAEGDATIEVTKALENAEWPEGKTLTFTLEGDGDAPMPTETTATLDAVGSVSFGPISYELADAGKTYTYTVKEDGFGGTWESSGDVTVTVEVTDNGDGTLATNVSYDPDDQTITNTYKAEGEAVIEVTKALAGAAWPEDKTLTLTLSGEGGTLPTTKTVELTKAGKATFGAIKYTEADIDQTYTYTISEDGFGDGWTGSGDVTATVTITDKGDGTLKTEVTYSPSATITNTYEAEGTAQLQATKELKGRDWKSSDEFTFELYDEDGNLVESKTAKSDAKTVTFSTLTYNQDQIGDHTYTISEKTDNLPNGVEKTSDDITATVTVTDNGDGTLATSVSYNPSSDKITNTYTPASVNATLEVNKTITGYLSDDTGNADATFKFELYDADGTKIDETEITTEGGEGKASFDEITYTEAGTYTYTVKETIETKAGFTYDAGEYTVTVEVTDNTDEGQLETEITYKKDDVDKTDITFENEFKMKSVKVDLELEKEIEDQSDSAPDSTFTFKLYKDSVSDDNLVDTKTITTENLKGSTKFEDLEFKEADEYTYVVVEENTGENGFTYDTTEHTYKIVVNNNFDVAILEVDEDESTLKAKITNIYKAADTAIVLKVTKEIEDTSGSAYDTEFTFTLMDENGETIETKSITGAGEVEFSEIPYEKAGTYTYYIQESVGDAKGYSYDTKKYKVTVKVVDEDAQLVATPKYDTDESGEGDTSLTVTNTYDPEDAKVVLKARKVVEDKTGGATGKTFKFELRDADGNLVETVTRKGGGPIEFSALTFSKVGEYNYTIQEVEGSDAGYTYDTTPRDVTITVTDPDQDGVLKATVSPDPDEEEIVITNPYEAEPVSVRIEAHKMLDGRKLKKGEFTFQLLEDGEVIDEAMNKADGTILFSEIEYDVAGTHYYTIVEVEGDDKDVIYDDEAYSVTVKVIDDGEGQLTVDVSGIPTFTNTVQETPPPDEPDTEPDTGDHNSPFAALAVFLLAGAGLGGTYVYRRRKEDE